MATLAVWRFGSSDGAGRAALVIERLAVDGALTVEDAAYVEWAVGQRRPRTHQLTSTATRGALGVGFWDLLFGLVFFVPLLGAAIGAATGAVAGALADVGIDDHFINRIRDRVTPGTSALFLLTSRAAVDQVRDAFAGGPRTELIATELLADQEAALRLVFGD